MNEFKKKMVGIKDMISPMSMISPRQFYKKESYIFSKNFLNEEDLQKRFEEIVWCTYRKNFVPIEGFSTDSGWGCMLRSTQMLLCECMIRLYGSSKKNWIIQAYFVDTPDSPYSIYNFIKIAKKYGKSSGEWYEPTLSLLIARDLLLENKSILTPIVSKDGCLNISGIEENLMNQENNSEHDPLLNPLKKSKYLFLIPIKLGTSKLNSSIYGTSLIEILKFPQCVGFVGGRQSSSLFFIGSQTSFRDQKELIYLDPHTVQNVSSDINTYKCKELCTISIEDVNPSIAMGFLISSLDEFIDFRNKIKKYNVFSIIENTVENNIDDIIEIE
jgi:cysteine protease ATG4